VARRGDHLRSVPLFAACTDRELARIDQSVDELDVVAGTVLTNQGDIGREAFIVVSGTASVVRDGVEVATVGPGAQIGELALLDGGPRSATVTATTDMSLLILSKGAFNGVLDEIPILAHRIAVELARRLRAVEDSTYQ
jgi:CRP/FNR family transcriptional regulator, cyclic AMP receptor protein